MPAQFDLMVAPNGARKGKADHPALPISPAELADTARACAAAGATAIHLHVRDEAGGHTLDAGRYREAVAAVQAASGLRIQISTEAVGIFDVAAQIECIAQVRAPEVSMALREFERTPERLAEAYRVADAAGSDVQHILYSADDVTRLIGYLADGTIPARFDRVLFVLGRYSSGQLSAPEDLGPFLDALGAHPLTWSVCAFGAREQACLLAALAQSGNVRIGFENNTVAPDGAPFADNAAAVAALVHAAAPLGFQPGQD